MGDAEADIHEIEPDVAVEYATAVPPAALVDLAERRVSVNIDGRTHAFDVLTRTERWSATSADRIGAGDAVVSPFPAVVAEMAVAPGDTVVGDQVLMTIEAMKMLHPLRASGAATVDEVRVVEGDQVAANQVLITFDKSTTQGESP